MTKTHRYEVTVTWTGNRGHGTSGYRAYGRAHEVTAPGKTGIAGSSDPAFRGDPDRWNPEELLLASVSQCHMLWYLHLCATNAVVVDAYVDQPEGTMAQTPDGGGHFVEIVLRPQITVAEPQMVDRAVALHEDAHRLCFVANSVNFPIHHQPVVQAAIDVEH